MQAILQVLLVKFITDILHMLAQRIVGKVARDMKEAPGGEKAAEARRRFDDRVKALGLNGSLGSIGWSSDMRDEIIHQAYLEERILGLDET